MERGEGKGVEEEDRGKGRRWMKEGRMEEKMGEDGEGRM
jgi:hypothetical protein